MQSSALGRIRGEGLLRHALERDEFVVHYQPQQDLKSAISDHAMDGADPERIHDHFGLVEAIGAAAGTAASAVTPAKSVPKKYAAACWLATQLKPIFEQATGRRANAYSSENRATHPLGKRGSPFVRFVAEFIRPFAPELYKPGLGEAIHHRLR